MYRRALGRRTCRPTIAIVHPPLLRCAHRRRRSRRTRRPRYFPPTLCSAPPQLPYVPVDRSRLSIPPHRLGVHNVPTLPTRLSAVLGTAAATTCAGRRPRFSAPSHRYHRPIRPAPPPAAHCGRRRRPAAAAFRLSAAPGPLRPSYVPEGRSQLRTLCLVLGTASMRRSTATRPSRLYPPAPQAAAGSQPDGSILRSYARTQHRVAASGCDAFPPPHDQRARRPRISPAPGRSSGAVRLSPRCAAGCPHRSRWR